MYFFARIATTLFVVKSKVMNMNTPIRKKENAVGYAIVLAFMLVKICAIITLIYVHIPHTEEHEPPKKSHAESVLNGKLIN